MREPWLYIYICEAPCFTWAYYSLLCSCSKNNKRVLSWPIFACWCHTIVKGKIQVFKFWVNTALFVDCRSFFTLPPFHIFFILPLSPSLWACCVFSPNNTSSCTSEEHTSLPFYRLSSLVWRVIFYNAGLFLWASVINAACPISQPSMPRPLFKQLCCEMFAFSAFARPHTDYYFILLWDVLKRLRFQLVIVFD